ncbi:MAG: alanine racemase [Clostridia bacterium]|nr:alanine racemase [Clostridia bacterium]
MQKTLSYINLRAVRNNALKIRSALGKRKFFAVVKADAYGHGAEEVARAIEDIADCFCVAIIDEGVKLRVAGITKPILVFTPPLDVGDIIRAKAYNLSVTVNSVHSAQLSKGLKCHIKVNTGMNRSGCNLSELDEVLKNLSADDIEGLYSHLYAPENNAASAKQLALFNAAESKVKRVCASACAHLAASGGILRGGSFLKNGARAGILLYGYAPAGFSRTGYIPALKVYARRTQVTPYIGGGVGYNISDKNYKDLNIYRLGYADGFFRGVPLGEKTLCMDAFISARGEEFRLVMADADEYAAKAGTISYEVLCSVTRRSLKIYER